VGDAEIIPIGTRGRPGRGTGTRPSSAARGLAPGAHRSTRGPGEGDDTPAAPPVADVPLEPGSAPGAGGAGSAPPDGTSSPDATSSRVGRSATTTVDRHPLGGVPVGDWLAAFRHGAAEVFGDQWETQLARFLAFWRRRITGDYAVDDFGFDQELTERFLLASLRPLAQKWFRLELRGAHHVPASGGALIVSNHSGTIPVDGLMSMVAIHDQTGRHVRALAADLVFALPGVSSLARKAGATLACHEDAERMLRGGELVGVWPEGFKGIGKPYADRYKLQRFGRGGFVSAALRTGVPIIPLSVVGAEEIYPLVGNVPALARLLGVPYVPITPFFPWLGPLGMVPLPSKWMLELGEPIRTDEHEPGAADDPMLVFDVTDQVRETIQQTLYALLMERESIFG